LLNKDKAQNLLSVYLFVILHWFVCIILGKRDFSWGGGQNVIRGGTGPHVKKGPAVLSSLSKVYQSKEKSMRQRAK
jgi:hypothetical protein